MNQKLVYGIIGVVLIGAVVYFAVGRKSEQSNNQQIPTNNNTQSSNQTITPTPTPSQISTTQGDKFDEKSIIKSVSFNDSVGVSRKFIIVRVGELKKITVGVGESNTKSLAGAYITDSNLYKSTAIEIPNISAIDLGFVGNDTLLVSVSSGPGKKFIIVSYQIGDSYPTLLLDEKGTLISENVVGNAYQLVKDKCQCGFGFESGKIKTNFMWKSELPEVSITELS